MADVGKLISLENLLVRKVTWFVVTSTSGPFCPTHLEPTTWQGLPIYTLVFQKLVLSHFDFQRQHSLPSFRLPETAWLCQLVKHISVRVTWVRILSATLSFPILPFRLNFFQSWTQPHFVKSRKRQTANMGKDTFLLEYLAIFCTLIPHIKYLVNIHFIVYRTILIFSFSLSYSC